MIHTNRNMHKNHFNRIAWIASQLTFYHSLTSHDDNEMLLGWNILHPIMKSKNTHKLKWFNERSKRFEGERERERWSFIQMLHLFAAVWLVRLRESWRLHELVTYFNRRSDCDIKADAKSIENEIEILGVWIMTMHALVYTYQALYKIGLRVLS